MRAVFASLPLLPLLAAAIPAEPHNFTQLVTHFSTNPATFQQRYYENASNWGGPGSPIICIVGGEGGIPPSTGIFYPPVVVMAERMRAFIIEPEHRFFGTSVPEAPYDTDRLTLLTVQQALADTAAFIQAQRSLLNCTGEPGSGPRCPVITVGGSYPGFLSAMMRLRYPAVVDAAWAASAPMGFYSQAVAPTAYYERVTASAARADPRCPPAVRATVNATLGAPGLTKEQIVAGANLCTPLPPYLEAGDAVLLKQELAMVFQASCSLFFSL